MKLKLILPFLFISGCSDYLPSLAPDSGWLEVRCDVVPYTYDWRTKVYTLLDNESYTKQYREVYSSSTYISDRNRHRKDCESMVDVMEENYKVPYKAIVRDRKHWDLYFDFPEITLSDVSRRYY